MTSLWRVPGGADSVDVGRLVRGLAALLVGAMVWLTLPAQASQLPEPSEAPAPEGGGDEPVEPAGDATPESQCAVAAPAASSNVLVVDGVTGLDQPVEGAGGGLGTAAAPYRTIGKAVARAAELGGAQIKVRPAVYAESVSVTACNVVLQSVSRSGDTAATGSSWGGLLRGTVTVDASRVTIDGFAFVFTFGDPPVPGVRWSAVFVQTGEQVVISDNVIDGSASDTATERVTPPEALPSERPGQVDQAFAVIPATRGIQVSSGSGASIVVTGNVIRGVQFGIDLTPGSEATIGPDDTQGAALANVIERNSLGIQVATSGVVHIQRNVIKDNHDQGVAVHAGWNPTGSIRRNDFVGNVGPALWVHGTSVVAQQNWWGSRLGPRQQAMAPGDLQPSPMPTLTGTPVPTPSPTPDPNRPKEEVDRQVVSGVAAGAFTPFCAAAQCPVAPVLVSGRLTGSAGAGLPSVALSVSVVESPSVTRTYAGTTASGATAGAFGVVVTVPWDTTKPASISVSTPPAGYEAKTFSVSGGVSDLPEQAVGALALVPHGTIEVIVRDKAAAVTNATVTAKPSSSETLTLVHQAASPGTYRLKVPAGSFTVSVAPPATPTFRLPSDFTVAVTSDAVVSTVVDLTRLWEIRSTVQDQSGQAVTSAAVAVWGPEHHTCTFVSPRYTCSVPEGTYTVKASDGPRHGAETVVEVGPGKPTPDLLLTVVDVVWSGIVRKESDDKMRPAAGIRVEASSPDHAPVAGTTAGDGSFSLALPAGTWSVRAEDDGYQDARVGPFQLSAGARQTTNLVMRPRATSTGGGSGVTSGSDGDGGSGTGDSGTAGAGVPGPAPLPPVAPQPGPDGSDDAGQEQRAERVSGSDRNATAASLSASSYPDGAPIVFVASAGGFADALAGGPAAARRGGPVLLVDRDKLPESTRAEIERLGAGNVVVLGGPGAVSPSVESQLRALGVDVARLSGNDRFATAAAVSRQTFSTGVDVAYVATGGGFADALSGGAAAAHLAGPVVLVESGAIPTVTGDELRRLRPGRIVVLGGSQAVSPAVEAKLREYSVGGVQRISGPNRYATSAAIAAQAFPDPVGTVFVATGENFPDALAGVPAAAKAEAPLLLVQRDDVPEPVADQLRRLRPRRIVILGGEGAVSRETQRELGGYATE